MNRMPVMATLLCALASLLVPGIAAASAVSSTEDRVWAFDLAEQVHVAGAASLTPELHQGCELAGYDSASGSLLAAKGGAKPFRVGPHDRSGGLSVGGKDLRLDYGRLPNQGKAANRLPGWLRGRKVPHYHRRGTGGIGRHRPWQRTPGVSWWKFWERF